MLAVAVADLAAAVVASTSCWEAWWRYGGLASRTPEQVTSRMTRLVMAVGGRRSRGCAGALELVDGVLEVREAGGDVRLKGALHQLDIVDVLLDALECLVDREDHLLEVRCERIEARLEGVLLLHGHLLEVLLGLDERGPLLEEGGEFILDRGLREVAGEALLDVLLDLLVRRLLGDAVHERVVRLGQLDNPLVLRTKLAVRPALDLVDGRPGVWHVSCHIGPGRSRLAVLGRLIWRWACRGPR